MNFNFFKNKKRRIVVLSFEGGMGSQIFQVALFEHLRKSGVDCVGDFSYFDESPEIATVGSNRRVSHWGWELNSFDLPISKFPNIRNFQPKTIELAHVSEIYAKTEITRLSQEALNDPEIRRSFRYLASVSNYIPLEILKSSVCCHIRRGDYVNVASHLIVLNEFYDAARALRWLSRSLILLSDSVIDKSVINHFSEFFDSVIAYDDISAETAHAMMRMSKGLICSNSTFSLSAALLGDAQVVLFPKRWYTGDDAEEMNAAIGNLSSWQIFSR